MSAVLNPVDAVIVEISSAMHAWSKEQVEIIGPKVRERLDRHREEVLMKLMGFTTDWNGKWEVDHCNGRNGNSNISDFLKESQEAVVKDWLSQIQLPEMTPKFKKNIELSLKRAYEDEVSRSVYSMAKNKAQKDLEEILSDVLPKPDISNFLKAQALITPQPSTS